MIKKIYDKKNLCMPNNFTDLSLSTCSPISPAYTLNEFPTPE